MCLLPPPAPRGQEEESREMKQSSNHSLAGRALMSDDKVDTEAEGYPPTPSHRHVLHPRVRSPPVASVVRLSDLSPQAQRLVFDQSSPNGILLFRECSKIAVAFGTRLLQVTLVQNPAPRDG